jgi:putative glycosyltransferase (TIGR04372 family)
MKLNQFKKNIAKILNFFLGDIVSKLIIKVSNKFNIKYTGNNLWGATGHTIPEIDLFLRKKYLGHIKKEWKVVLLSREKVMTKIIYRLFKKHFYFRIISVYIEIFIKKKVLAKNLNLNLNIGLNASNCFDDTVIPHSEMYSRFNSYYKIRKKTKKYNAFKEIIFNNELNNFFQFNLKKTKYIVLQIKTTTANATAIPTDIKGYLPTIKYFKRLGFKIIFAGGVEKYPAIFKKFGVINYNLYKKQSIYTDLELISKANFVLCAASGFSWYASLYNVPTVYSNNWQIIHPPYGEFIIQLPLKFLNKNDQLVKFSEIIKHNIEIDNYNFNAFDKYKVIASNGKDILEASKEAMNLTINYENASIDYINFKNKYKKYPIYFSESRISKNFMEKNKMLF